MAVEKKDEEKEKDPMENVRFKVGKEFSGWVIIKTLDEGGFGQVYLVKSKDKKRTAALKAESNDVEGGSAIKLEAMILRQLNKSGPAPHIPELYVSVKRTKFCFMIMTLLGENLKTLKARRDKERFTKGTWSRLGIQCLYGLKYIHDCGFVHRDIKPQNFMMGNENDKERARIVHILDFGLARPFAYFSSSKNKWIARRARGTAEFRGTLRYTSPNVHLRKEQGRADDVWSLMFVLIELNGRLPWQTTQNREEVELMKVHMKDSDVMLNMPTCLSNVLPHLRTLDCYQRPDYHMIFKGLWTVMSNEGQTPSSRFDWETKDPDPSVPPADWENPDGRFFKLDPIKISAKPDKEDAKDAKDACRNGVSETTIGETTDALKSEKAESLNGKKAK